LTGEREEEETDGVLTVKEKVDDPGENNLIICCRE